MTQETDDPTNRNWRKFHQPDTIHPRGGRESTKGNAETEAMTTSLQTGSGVGPWPVAGQGVPGLVT